MPTQKELVIEAIKNLDFNWLEELLEDNKIYGDISKKQFIQSLKKGMKPYSEMNGFDDAYYGVCQSCRKSCEVITFISEKSGYYLDIIIDGEEEVEDFTFCSNAINFIPLNKVDAIYIQIYADDRISYKPNETYLFWKDLYNIIKTELSDLDPVKKLTDIFAIVDRHPEFLDLSETEGIDNSWQIRLIWDISRLKEMLEDLIHLKNETFRAHQELNALSKAKTEYEKLVWYFENKDGKSYCLHFGNIDTAKPMPQILEYSIRGSYFIDVSGYKNVLKYFRSALHLEEFFMKESTLYQGTTCPYDLNYNELIDYFQGHSFFPELVAKYGK